MVEDGVGDPEQVGHRFLLAGAGPGQGEQPGVIEQVPIILAQPVFERRRIEAPLGELDDERVFVLCLPDVLALL